MGDTRASCQQESVCQAWFMPPNGMHALKLYAVCNPYLTADHDPGTDPIEVAKGEENQSDEDGE